MLSFSLVFLFMTVLFAVIHFAGVPSTYAGHWASSFGLVVAFIMFATTLVIGIKERV